MKIIHTSDWHLGDRLSNYDRTDEEDHFFGQLAAVVEREQPDALVVSGDVFDMGVPGNDVAKRFTDRLLDVLEKCPTMETVVIAGNHDSYSRLVVDESLWSRFRVHVFGRPAEDEGGKAVFARNVVEIPGKGLIAAVPFCHSRNFPTVEATTGHVSPMNAANPAASLASRVLHHAAHAPCAVCGYASAETVTPTLVLPTFSSSSTVRSVK